MTTFIRRECSDYAKSKDSADYNKRIGWGKSGESDFFREICLMRPSSRSAGRARNVLAPKRSISRRVRFFSILIFSAVFLASAFSAVDAALAIHRTEESRPPVASSRESQGARPGIAWYNDYATAVQAARDASKNLLIYFVAETDSPKLLNETEERFVAYGNGTIRQLAYTSTSMQQPLPIATACRAFERNSLADEDVLACLDQYVLLKWPHEARTTDAAGRSVVLLESPEFEEMQGLPGLAVVDFEHQGEPYYGRPTGILPFVRAQAPTPDQTLTFLTLPPGTLTQRTLIYAVRIHPERPLSAQGSPEPVLLKEAGDHAAYQSKIGVLGHQNFGARTARIASMLGVGAAEICAQSWAGEGLFEGAISCVRSWRTSPPHWRNVRAGNRYYGYDMVRGRNNIWYATGLVVK